MAKKDFKGDFMGFTFKGVHSSDLNIVRTSDGSRYNSELLPSFNDNTVAVPGGDGTYYFGSYYNQKSFSIQFATDELSEAQFRQLRQWLGDKGIHDLIFDEAPYKVYSAKIAAVPNFNYICFDEGTDHRTYKGEGTIQFVCYYPFARSRWKGLNEVTGGINSTEWAAASGLPANAPAITTSGDAITISLNNVGDLETDINIITTSQGTLTFSLDSNTKIVLTDLVRISGDTAIRINSKNNLIEGLSGSGTELSPYVLTGNLYNKYITEGNFFKIPQGTSTLTGVNGMKIEYDYLYY